MILQQRSSSASVTVPTSLQHNVVLHSNVHEPLLPATNRLDLEHSFDQDTRNQSSRRANSLMTVYEQPASNETTIVESSSRSETWRGRSPSSICDLTYQRTSPVPTEEKPSDQDGAVRRQTSP